MKHAPATIQRGMMCLLSGPSRMRSMCGMTRPMNPMTPTKDTAAATTTVDRMSTNSLVLFTSTPRSMAWESPIIMAFRGFACVMSRMEQTVIIGAMRAISLQSALPRFPMVQKTMPSSLSPEMNVRKDTRADSSEDTATPDRMSVSVFTPPPARDMV